jgi:hypothetical protein
MRRVLVSCGWLGILAGVLLNEWTFARLFSDDGDLQSSTRILIAVLQALLIASGAALVAHRRVARMVLGFLAKRKIGLNEQVFLCAYTGWNAGFLYFVVPLHVAGIAARQHPLFPGVFDAPATLIAASVGPPLAALVLVGTSLGVARLRRRYLIAAVMLVIASLGRIWHSDQYSDATGVVFFWTACWIAWFGANIARTDRSFYIHGVTLGHGVIGLVFLGGFVGKLTADYWTGTATYALLLNHDKTLFARLAQQLLGSQQQMALARFLGRATIACEGLLAIAVFLPTRLLAVIAFATWLGMLTTVGIGLLALVLPMTGLLASCWLLDRCLQGLPPVDAVRLVSAFQ